MSWTHHQKIGQTELGDPNSKKTKIGDQKTGFGIKSSGFLK
jgi:hypothetical protein